MSFIEQLSAIALRRPGGNDGPGSQGQEPER
jgi:hypothetical protein